MYLRGCFCFASEGRLAPGEEDNAAQRKTDRKDWTILK
ncbi:hypothetical protein HMPREF1141_2391 [Clostridium sp. MSTE9]|nr:hypothetical protein HMPREF1141_2391 [Clostridium sp. MSTE9]